MAAGGAPGPPLHAAAAARRHPPLSGADQPGLEAPAAPHGGGCRTRPVGGAIDAPARRHRRASTLRSSAACARLWAAPRGPPRPIGRPRARRVTWPFLRPPADRRRHEPRVQCLSVGCHRPPPAPPRLLSHAHDRRRPSRRRRARAPPRRCVRARGPPSDGGARLPPPPRRADPGRGESRARRQHNRGAGG